MSSEYQIGDRVILRGLKGAPHLNGRHGLVTGSANAAGRYHVDTDLWDPESPNSLGVKAANLQPEPPLPPDTHRAGVHDGVIEEKLGIPLSMILEAVRYLAAKFLLMEDIEDMMEIDRFRSQGMSGLTKINKWTATAWSYWLDPGGFHTPESKGIYDLLRDWTKSQLKERDKAELAAMTQDELEMLHVLTDAVNDPAGAQGWNVRIHGDFWVVSMDDSGTYLVPPENTKRVYLVLGVRNAIYPMCVRDFSRPVLMKLTMIPFYGRLIYDGVVLPGGKAGFTGMPLMASVSKAEKLFQAVESAKKEGRVVDRLRQLEVPGGSREGLPNQGMKKPTTKHETEQEPPTREEEQLVSVFQKVTPHDNGDKLGYWVMRRAGYTLQENPNHLICVMNAVGMTLDMFSVNNLEEPTSCEILKKTVEVCKRTGKRPYALGIDEENCYHRVKFLLKDVAGTLVQYYMPPTKEETDAYKMMGPRW